jgi:hypothetical protein
MTLILMKNWLNIQKPQNHVPLRPEPVEELGGLVGAQASTERVVGFSI